MHFVDIKNLRHAIRLGNILDPSAVGKAMELARAGHHIEVMATNDRSDERLAIAAPESRPKFDALLKQMGSMSHRYDAHLYLVVALQVNFVLSFDTCEKTIQKSSPDSIFREITDAPPPMLHATIASAMQAGSKFYQDGFTVRPMLMMPEDVSVGSDSDGTADLDQPEASE